jgi:hypothetical protein
LEKSFMPKPGTKAQSFIEFALILPILLLLVLGVVELTLYIGTYINLVDLTREAARFASQRDPFASDLDAVSGKTCTDPAVFNLYYQTACVFSPLEENPTNPQCVDAAFCNGFNSTVQLKPDEDDILISVFTVRTDHVNNAQGTPEPNGQIVSDQWPSPNGVWVWSDEKLFDTSHTSNWRRDCNRLTTAATANPFFTASRMESYLQDGSTPSKGFVVVETYYCYHQALNAPVFAQILPNPVVIHAYTVMPLPAAQPTPTNRPTPTP